VHGVGEWFFLLGAGALAGIIGTAGGITSLVSYPALLAAGLSPLTANVTNSIALLGSGFGSSVQARADISGHAHTLRTWVAPTVLFSLGGAILLIVTPGNVFARIVPFLVATGSIVLLLQPAIGRWQARHGAQPNRTVRVAGAGVAVYNGYFGAGAGILLIALLLFSTEPVLHRANALKNVILVAADILPAVLFALFASVTWFAVWPLGVGALVGGLVGPVIARRVPAPALRILIAACGLILAVRLFLDP
jgi:uncharacterized membrane protein YfcA